jgi:hypothetical protein
MQETQAADKILGTALVPAGKMEKLELGVYENSTPWPELSLEFNPAAAADSIGASLIRTDEGDHYTLVYLFQNYGDVACHVTARDCTARVWRRAGNRP